MIVEKPRLDCTLFCLALAGGANAAVVEELTYRYYTAAPGPGESLLTAIERASPFRQTGRAFHGYTEWWVKWNVRWFEQPDGRCRITEVVTRVDVRITLPNWDSAAAPMSPRLEAYLSGLRQHELGHYRIVKEAAAEIDQAIERLPEMPTCKLLESAADDAGYRILEVHKKRENDYDVSTEYGKTQGAWLER